MRDELPPQLIEFLSRLHLATPEQVRGVHGAARRLAHDLPLFDSVWIDALVQARVLTAFQAAEWNAGRGEQLVVGPYVLRRLVQRLGYADCYLAVTTSSDDKPQRNLAQCVHLVVVRGHKPECSEQTAARIQAVVQCFATIKSSQIACLRATGLADDAVWAAYTLTSGFPAGQWLSCHGRLPPAAVLEIARQMTAALATLEGAGIVHGDIAASSLWLSETGHVTQLHCGMRAAVRRDEHRHEDLLPVEALDYLAPERLHNYSPVSISSDIYSCGCLWWHLLAGRPPIVGGDKAAKLRSVQQGQIPDIRHIAPDVDERLAAAIDRCTQRDPALRMQSFAELTQHLGASTAAGRRRLAAALQTGGWRRVRPNWSSRVHAGVHRAGRPLLAAAACTLLLAVATWPLWRLRPAPDDRPVANVRIDAARSAAKLDRAIHQASYHAPENQPLKPLAAATAPTVIELLDTAEISGASLRLQPGTVVRGSDKRRPRIVVPPNGLVIAVDNVRFENVDFLWRQRPEKVVSPDHHALIDVRCARVQFVGCTFQATPAAPFEQPAAIRLRGNSQRSMALAPAARVQLDRCVLQGVDCGIECTAGGPTSIALHDTLYLGRGALVRFPRARPIDAPAAIELEHLTLRGAASVLELSTETATDQSGSVTIAAAGCVFAPNDAGGLVVFSGRNSPRGPAGGLKSLEWSGQGSLIGAKNPVVVWQHGGRDETLSEDELPIEGLVSSPFEFVGLATNDPAASRLRRWLGPSHSEQPPGIGDGLPAVPVGGP